jgi:protein CpxP
MTISKRLFAISTAAVLAVGLMFAQAPAPHRGPGGGPGGERGLQFLSTALDLTDAQQAQAKTIFDAAQTQSQPLQDQLKANHDAITAAIKANKSDQELQQLGNTQGGLLGQLAGIHAVSMSHFYQLLTPDQKTKFDTMQQKMRGFMGAQGAGMRPRG